MGCNSHLSIEVNYGSAWEPFALDVPESRNYNLYEAMAGVRGYSGNAVVRPRGIPKDVSRVVEYWIKRASNDGHTHSWLSSDEFHRAMLKGYGEGTKEWDAIDGVLTTLKMLLGETNVRLIFFFDN